ncbi:MAG: hypothetical protein RML15_06970 [Bacteroidota bacterium]|nr:hypothetical protein [Bacteroidota bacterium]
MDRCRAPWNQHASRAALVLGMGMSILLAAPLPQKAQQLLVTAVNTTNFPQIGVRLYSFDAEGNPAPLDPLQDRLVTERMSVVRQTTGIVDCPPLYQPTATTTVFAFDWTSQAIEQQAATAIRQWFSAVPSGSEVGIVAFGVRPYLLADVTNDSAVVLASLERFPRLEAAIPYRALLDSLLGAIAIGARGRHRRSVVMVTEHLLPDPPPAALRQMLQTTGTQLMIIAVGHAVPNSVRAVCLESGGIVLDHVDPSELPSLLRMIAAIATGYQPCSIAWQSIYDCSPSRSVVITAPSIGARTEFSYTLAPQQTPLLDILPRYRDLGTYPPGITPPQEIVLTALNADITVLAVTTDPTIEIADGQITLPFLLRAGQQYRFRVRLRIARSERTVGAVRIVSTSCTGIDAIIIAANVRQPTSNTAQFLYPDAATTSAYAGLPLRLQWTGTLPSDSVALLLQQVGDTVWTPLATDLTTFEYTWQLPLEGRYRFRLLSKRGMLHAESGTVVVTPPPFGIIAPAVPQARVGSVVEFRPAQLLCSDTTVSVPIDSLRFAIGRSFSLVRDIPNTIPPGTCVSTWFRFSPQEEGIHTDTLSIYTPYGVRRSVVEGIATESQLLLPSTIRLGTLPIGTSRDTLVQWLACVKTPQQVRLRPIGPDTTQIQLLTIRQFSLTEETPCMAYPFGVRAQRVGRTCLRLLVEGQQQQSYECVLVGDVICAPPYSGAVLAAPQSIVTQAGRVITIPVWMPSVPPGFRSMQRPYRFTVRCNASTLLPEPPLERGTIINGERIIPVTGRGFLQGDTLAVLRFGTYWGDAPIVPVRIENFQWLDDCALDLVPVSVTVMFTDYCTAGGTTRLFLSGAAPLIERIEPQPSDGTLQVTLSADSRMPVHLRCLDMLGTERWHTNLGMVEGSSTHSLQLELPSGTYVLQACSPGGISSTLLVITR